MPTTVTHVIAASGGDYTSLSAWQTAQVRNLVTADQIAVAEVRDFGLAENLNLTGWTTDATRYVKIVCPVAYRHSLRPRSVSGSGFRMGTLVISGGHVYLEGLELFRSDGAGAALEFGSPTLVDVDSCLIHDTRTGSVYAVEGSPASLTLRMRNTVVYGASRSIDTRTMAAATIHNCVFWRTADQLGVVCDTELTCKNTYSGKSTGTAEDFWTGAAAPAGNNNVSSDSTATIDYPTGSLTSIAGSAVFASVTAGAEDFRLKAGTNALVGAGEDLSASFTTDAQGDTRNAPWDIGADQYAAPASTLSGNVTLDAIAPAGTIADAGPTSLSGDVTLDAIAPAGTLSQQPGVVTVPALRNWSGSLQTSVTIPVVTVLSMTTGAQVLALTDQTTDGTTAELSITNAALVAGTTYMVAGWNADGSQRFAVPITAA
jgi:hypothetical protein